jgi:hypothetical protein
MADGGPRETPRTPLLDQVFISAESRFRATEAPRRSHMKRLIATQHHNPGDSDSFVI